MLGMGYDAGTHNAAYSIIKLSKKSFDFLEIGMIDSTFKNMTDNIIYKKPTKADRAKAKKAGVRLLKTDMPSFLPLKDEFPKFYKVIEDITNEYKLEYFIGERFQTRGNGGPLIEMVSMQLGVIYTINHMKNIASRLVVASQWKNKVNSISNLEDIYAYAHQFNITPHECDSTGMALYQADALGVLPLEISIAQWRRKLSTYVKRN
jgi:hypothetical protein